MHGVRRGRVGEGTSDKDKKDSISSGKKNEKTKHKLNMAETFAVCLNLFLG